MQELHAISIKELSLSKRTYHILIRNKIYTIEDLNDIYRENKLNKIHMFGERSLKEISKALEEFKKKNPLSNIVQKDFLNQNNNENEKIEIKNNFSIELLNLKPAIRGRLKKSGIQTIDDLMKAPDSVLLNINQIGPKKLQDIKRLCNEFTPYANMSTVDTSAEIIETAQQIQVVERKNQTWASTIEDYFRNGREIYSYILISRFGFKLKKLEELATELGVTRERVRQIQDATAIRYLKYLSFSDASSLIEKTEEIFLEYGDNLSLTKFKSILKRNGILGRFTEPLKTKYISNLDLFETMICWLNLISNKKYTLQPIDFSINIFNLLQSGNISIRDNNTLLSISSKERKNIKRKILFTGGITISEAQKILSKNERITFIALKNLNLQKIDNEWFSFKDLDEDRDNKKIPLRVAGLKMLSVNPIIDINSFHDGLRRHSMRFYASIAPLTIIAHILPMLGFEIENSWVSTQLPTKGYLSKSEQSLVSAIRKNGGVVSFLEAAEEFFLQNLSLPAVSVTLKRSPISEKVDEGFYKLRGAEVSWQQIEDAKKRQKRFSQEDAVNYGLDGVIRMKLTVNSYAYLTGVVGAYSIKGLSGSWLVTHQNQSFGDAKKDEVYLWGLSKAFKELNIKMGDRIELGFNTWNRTISIQKVKHEN